MRKLLLVILCLFFIMSCSEIDPIENHKGGVVYEKRTHNIYPQMLIKYKTKNSVYKYKYVCVSEIDFKKYQILDTIK